MKVEKKFLSSPLTAQLEVTDFCNHRCIHCYNLDSSIEYRPIQVISDETVLACAQRLIDSGIFAVVLTGGEPLIKKRLTTKLIRLFRENNIRVSLNSNLTLFDDDFIEFLKEVEVGVLTSCPSAIPTSFEKLVGVNNYVAFERNIKKMAVAGVKFTVNMVVTKDNLHEIRATAEKMKELGCESFAATPVALNMNCPRLDLLLSRREVYSLIEDLLWIKQLLNLRIDILEALPKCIFPQNVLNGDYSFLSRKCQAGRTVITVSCNGEVRPCAHNSVSYGNILKEDLRDIWVKMADWRSTQYIPSRCKECAWLNQCNGGCRTNAKALSGKWNAGDIWQPMPIEAPPPLHYKPIKLRDDTIIRINKEFTCRREDEDAIVIYNIKHNIFFMVNNKCCEFIVKLSEFQDIAYGDLKKKFYVSGNNRDFYDEIRFLIYKKILQII